LAYQEVKMPAVLDPERSNADLARAVGTREQRPRAWPRRFLAILGPGMVTGAADDDPSGIATYAQTGAQFGYGQLWTVFLILPLMVAVQEMCARIGLVTGKGLARVVWHHYPRVILYSIVGLLLIANTINLGADLGAMAAATRLLLPVPYPLLTILFALGSMLLEVVVSYHQYARVLKWLCLSLIAYVLTGFVVAQDWSMVLRATVVPRVQGSFSFLLLIVAVLGTTISPYMFFWQASEEVEEEIEQGQLARPQGLNVTGRLPTIGAREIRRMRVDTWVGMVFSQVTSWFIIITAAGTLHAAGQTDITTAAQAAQALEPLVRTFPHAGAIAKGIFALGIIGLGLLAVPIFAGSASYALADTFSWREGLYRKPREAPQFYGVMILATLAGLGINFVGINPIKALVYAAVINGIVAVPLILLILLMSNNRAIMGAYVNRRWVNVAGWCTFVAMALAALAMFVSWLP